jgi:hypothetical protein
MLVNLAKVRQSLIYRRPEYKYKYRLKIDTIIKDAEAAAAKQHE